MLKIFACKKKNRKSFDKKLFALKWLTILRPNKPIWWVESECVSRILWLNHKLLNQVNHSIHWNIAVWLFYWKIYPQLFERHIHSQPFISGVFLVIDPIELKFLLDFSMDKTSRRINPDFGHFLVDGRFGGAKIRRVW